MKKGREVNGVSDVLPVTERLYRRAVKAISRSHLYKRSAKVPSPRLTKKLSHKEAVKLILLLMDKFNITVWEVTDG